MRKSWLDRLNLQAKMLLAIVSLMLLVILLVVALVSKNMRRLIREETRVQGFTIAQLFGATNLNHFQSYDYLAIQQNANRAKSDNGLMYLIAYDKEGRIAADTEDPSLVSMVGTSTEGWRRAQAGQRQFLEIDLPRVTAFPVAPVRVFEVTFPVQTPDLERNWGMIQLGMSAETMRSYIRRTQLQILQIGLLSLALGVLGALVLSRRITGPVERLVKGALQAGSGDLSHRIEVHSGDELEKLAESFNSMMEQIQIHQDSRIRNEKMIAVGHMVNTILHDCRSPVTVIRGYASLLSDFEITESLQKESLDIIGYEVERLERMFEEILSFSRGEKPVLLARELAIDDFLTDCGREISGPFQETRIRLSLKLHCPSVALIDRDRLGRAVLNIAANAREALTGNGEFSIESHCEGSEAVIILRDNGPGIPDSFRSRIFEPFFTHGKPFGIGLGMSITRRIIEEHSGRISVESWPGVGTSFMIYLPTVQAIPRNSAPGV